MSDLDLGEDAFAVLRGSFVYGGKLFVVVIDIEGAHENMVHVFDDRMMTVPDEAVMVMTGGMYDPESGTISLADAIMQDAWLDDMKSLVEWTVDKMLRDHRRRTS